MSNLKWSTERPTVSGSYWLSVHPDKRERTWNAVEYVVYRRTGRICGYVEVIEMDCDNLMDLSSPIFDGAQWALRELPSDPFHKPSPSTHVCAFQEGPCGECS